MKMQAGISLIQRHRIIRDGCARTFKDNGFPWRIPWNSLQFFWKSMHYCWRCLKESLKILQGISVVFGLELLGNCSTKCNNIYRSFEKLTIANTEGINRIVLCQFRVPLCFYKGFESQTVFSATFHCSQTTEKVSTNRISPHEASLNFL